MNADTPSMIISASALAALKVEGLPSTKEGVRQKCIRDGWETKPASNRRKLIVVDALPSPLREKVKLAIMGVRIRCELPDKVQERGRPRREISLNDLQASIRAAAAAVARAQRQLKRLLT